MSQRVFFGAPFWILPLVLGLVVVALPYLGTSPATLRIIVTIALLSMLVVGLNMTFGFAGELALGQSFIYGVGAYLAGYLAIQGLDLSITFILAVLAAAAVGLLTGGPGLRLNSWSLAMVTFFTVLLIPNIVALAPQITGGAEGMSGIPLPVLFGSTLDSQSYYEVVVITAIVTIALLRNLVVSRHGVALKVMRESPILARSLGISVPRLKLTAYVISALPAGAAGALFASQDGYISPEAFGFQMTIAILAASVIGGTASIYGGIVGAAIMVIGPLRTSGFQEFSPVFFGVLLIAAGLFFTGGIASLVNRFVWNRLVEHDTLRADVADAIANPLGAVEIPGKALSVTGIVKDFGGNRALGGVDVESKAGTITALIGPNGSGKTTLLNIISGFYQPTSGDVSIDGRSMVGLKPQQIAAAGVSRTFQTPLVPKNLTAAEVVASARYSRSRISVVSAMLRLPPLWKARRADREQALRWLSVLGIVEHADRPASELPLGTRRLLEVARSLAGDPAVVLLDEPASGLDENEVATLATVIRRLRDTGANIVIVEHNFEMVMSISDTVYVLHLGKIIAAGAPEQVRSDPAVVESYLGKAALQSLQAEKKAAADDRA